MRQHSVLEWLAHPDVLDKRIVWHMANPRIWRTEMQRQFSLEIRVDYADPEKNAVMRGAMQAAARNMYATAVLLADNGAKPQIAVFSDDFFTGHEEIKLLEDTVAQGVKMIDGSSGKVDEGVSSELMRAALDIE